MKVISVNISKKKGTIKEPVSEIFIEKKGVKGDAHSGVKNREVSLLSIERIDHFSAESGARSFKPGEFAENITFSGIDNVVVGLSDRFKIGDAVLEVTQIGKECHGNACAIFKEVGKCVMPKEGIFCRTISGGRVRPGDEIIYIKSKK